MMIRYAFPLLYLCLIVLAVSCGTTNDTGPSPTGQLTPAQATEEYLKSLPQWERQAAQLRLDEQARLELKQDAREQMRQWVDEATPKCKDFFGSGNCRWVIIELEESDICRYKFSRQIQESEMEKEGHYYGVLVNEQGLKSGGYHWIASFNHLAYQDGAVLNITQCWNQNPEEYVMETK